MCKPETLQEYLTHIIGLDETATRVKLVAALEAKGLSRLEAEHEITRMTSYVKSYYEGVHAASFYVDADGVVFDCIPQTELPSARAARALGYEILATAPRPAPMPGQSSEITRLTESHSGPCADGAVLVRRITLEFLASFGTLEQYFQKYPQQHVRVLDMSSE